MPLHPPDLPRRGLTPRHSHAFRRRASPPRAPHRTFLRPISLRRIFLGNRDRHISPRLAIQAEAIQAAGIRARARTNTKRQSVDHITSI